MKRADLIRSIEQGGCVLVRHGGKHNWYRNPVTGVSQPVPRHREIKEPLACRMIRLLLDSSIDPSSPSAHPQPLVALQAQAPGRMLLHEGQRQGLARGVAPGRLQQQVWGRSSRRHPRTCRRQGCAGHRLGELQILGLLHHHLQLLAGAQQFAGGEAVALGGEGDPVEAAAERIHAAGFEV